MKQKKLKIILGSLVALCVIAVVASHFFDWPISKDDVSGDIAKSNRFSRQMDSEKLTNMEELVKNDTAYKEGIALANVVMQTRALQYGSLVDMSNEVAGGISEYADLLKEMGDVRGVVDNVSVSLATAVDDLNAVLRGEERPDLEQNTINASLAYSTLQKENALATRFIEITDKYLQKADGDDRLKFVRDQWVDYQQMTAALENDKQGAEELAKKGSLLSGEKSLAALASFGAPNQLGIIAGASMMKSFLPESSLRSAIPSEVLNSLHSTLASVATQYLQNTRGNDLNFHFGSAEMMDLGLAATFNAEALKAVLELSAKTSGQTLAAREKTLAATDKAQLAAAEKAQLAAVEKAQLAAADKAQLAAKDKAQLASEAQAAVLSCRSLFSIASADQVLSAYQEGAQKLAGVASLKSNVADRLNQSILLCSQMNEFINATALGNKASLRFYW